MKLQRTLTPFFAMAMAICAAPSLFAQATKTQEETKTQEVTAEKVFADYIEATGGEMAHKSVKSVISTGKIEIAMVGMEGTTKMQQKGGKALMVMSLPGVGEQRIGSDGKIFWQISEMTGPEIMTGIQAAQMKREMAAVSTYIGAKDNYDEINYVGVEEFDGDECHVITTKCEDEELETHYFSVESKFLIGRKGTQETPQGAMEMTTMMDDYKEVGGMKIPYTATVELPNGMSIVTTTDSVEMNTEISDDVFNLPEEIQELKDDE